MWIKYVITILLFYFFAVLQNSLFAHFNLFGTVPNLVFILFLLLVFFPARGWEIILYSVIAGFFLDIFSVSAFGLSIIFLLIIGFLIKKAQRLLRGGQSDNYPLVYFLALLLASLLAYHLLWGGFNLGWDFLVKAIYNLIFASVIFEIYKKLIFPRIDTRQLSLFK